MGTKLLYNVNLLLTIINNFILAIKTKSLAMTKFCIVKQFKTTSLKKFIAQIFGNEMVQQGRPTRSARKGFN